MEMYDWKHRILRVVPFFLVGLLTASFSSSSNKNKLPEIADGIYNSVYDTGTHVVLNVENLSAFGVSDQRFALNNVNGYRIVDYDYDRSGLAEYHDTVYSNDREVYVGDVNKFGVSTTNIEENEYKPGMHVIADVTRSSSLFGKDDVSFSIDAPVGYDVIDYDYDKTRFYEYETITYRNNTEVACDDRDDFGNPIGEVTVNDHSDGCYDIGEHKIVTINKKSNLWNGISELRHIVAPKGYRIIDYDYDKNDLDEHETIAYENIVPVYCDNKSQFGTPLNPVNDNLEALGEFEPYTHVLVRIEKKIRKNFGNIGTRQLVIPDGYELLDFDVNEDFEFETYVYTNTKRIYLEDTANFGTVIEQDEVKKKVLVF